MNIRVIKCTCHGVKFTRMKAIAERHNSRTLLELKQHVQFAENCKRCVPYVLKMLETGQTEFHEILENDSTQDNSPSTYPKFSGPSADYDEEDEL